MGSQALHFTGGRGVGVSLTPFALRPSFLRFTWAPCSEQTSRDSSLENDFTSLVLFFWPPRS